MKTNSTLLGLFIGLTVAILTHVVRTTSNEVNSIIFGCLLIIPVGYLGIVYRRKYIRDEQLVSNGLNHYRNHIHHRRVIKKTS